MDKPKTSKRTTPSLRAKKKNTDRQRSTSRPSTQSSASTPSSKQKKDVSQNSNRGNGGGPPKNVGDREPIDNDKNKKKEEKKKDPKKKSSETEKKPEPSLRETKVRVSQSIYLFLRNTFQEGVKKTGADAISNIEVIPDKNPAKMDDGYEDFGPGAA